MYQLVLYNHFEVSSSVKPNATLSMLNILRPLTVTTSRHINFLFGFFHTSIYSHTLNSSSPQNLLSLVENCNSIAQLKTLHAQIILHGLGYQTHALSKLVSFCALSPFGDLQYAESLFDKIPEPNRHMCNSLIRGFSNSKEPYKAIVIYRRMVCSGLFPNEFTFPFVLKACALEKAFRQGVLVHVHVIKLGYGALILVGNGLVHFYVCCGKIEYAQEVFDGIELKSLVSWNSMIGGYAKTGCLGKALLSFCQMREMEIEPDNITLVNLLSGCSRIHNVELGRLVHWYIEITGTLVDAYVQNALLDMYAKSGHLDAAGLVFERMVDKNVVSWTSMVSAYAKHGFVELAERTFEQMHRKNVISWNAMLSCYLQNDYYQQAIDLFSRMRECGEEPDETTMVTVLSACSQLGDLVTGEKLHEYVHNDHRKPSVTLYNAIIDMYAKCGSVEKALDTFLQMPEKNTVSWNVILGALAVHGHGLKAIEIFEQMETSSIKPDAITFAGLLSACCHSGLVDIGRYFFEKMTCTYKIRCDIEHYACMIDILGRVGLLEEAIQLIGRMPMKPDIVIWGTLLGACRTHKNVAIAKMILKQLLELEPYYGGLYVSLSNIFSEVQMWKDMMSIRKLMKNQGIRKSDAVSSIEINGCISEFMVDDNRHKTSGIIYAMLNQLTDYSKTEGVLSDVKGEFLAFY